ncbi:MAG: helix-turn-helix domain-containing protein [Lentisphaeria bacterium]
MGTGLGHYVRPVRINHGQWLLLNTDSPIEYISGECGFSSPQTFSRAFRNLVGVSPSQFRRKYK